MSIDFRCLIMYKNGIDFRRIYRGKRRFYNSDERAQRYDLGRKAYIALTEHVDELKSRKERKERDGYIAYRRSEI